MGTLETNVTQSPHPQTQPSPLTQPSSKHSRLMEHQIAIQLEICESIITAIKSLDQDVSENTNVGWKRIPFMYKKILFAMNTEDGETPDEKINTQII